MKNFLSIVGIAAMAIGLSAAEDIKTLLDATNYTGIVKQASELLSAAKTNSNQAAKSTVINGIIFARLKVGTYKTSAEAITDLESMMRDIGYTRDNASWARIYIYEKFNEFENEIHYEIYH